MSKKKYNFRIGKKGKRIISFTVALIMAASSLPVSDISDTLRDYSLAIRSYAATDGETYNVSSISDLVYFSNQYNNDPSFAAQHCNDTLSVAYGNNITTAAYTNFVPIGTAAHPFEGELKIDSGITFNLSVPLFDYVTDDMTISFWGNNTGNRALEITRTVTDRSPLFANHVVHKENSSKTAEWRINYTFFRPSTDKNVYDFGGFIGEIGEGAKVELKSLKFENVGDNNPCSVINGTGDTGLVCGTLGKNASLTIDEITVSNKAFDISSDGNVGGLVGAMGNGSVLTLASGLSNPQASGQSIIATDGYAGGIVGKNSGGYIDIKGNYQVSQIISGTKGAGGIAGLYSTVGGNHENTYKIKTDTVSFGSAYKINGTGSCGSLYGVVINDGDLKVSGSDNLSPNHNKDEAASLGGLFGHYCASALTKTLTIETTGTISPSRTNAAAKVYGGLIGTVGKLDDTYANESAYIVIDGVTVDAKNANTTLFGGLIGKADHSYIKLIGTNKANKISYSGIAKDTDFGGIVGSLDSGVLHLDGSTDLSGAAVSSEGYTDNSGQIVGKRNSGIVFAESTWTLTRSASGQTLDDIGSWGEVLRFGGNLSKNSVITVETGHYVTLKPAPETLTALENTTDFALTALNIQHNITNSDSGVLRTSGTVSSGILSTAIGLKDSTVSVDLSGTGITGLTRDNGAAAVSYSGEFNGNGGTVTLAAGEEYFSGGTIYRHKYNGMIAKTAGTASVTDLNMAGSIIVDPIAADMRIGLVIAEAAGTTLTLNGITTSSTAEIDSGSSDGSVAIGGFVGRVSAGSVNVGNTTACSFSGIINSSSSGAQIGGIIGSIHDGVFASSVKNTTVSGTITSSVSEAGGLIGVIDNSNILSSSRTLLLSNVDISGAAITNSSGSAVGGMLGYSWKATDVTFGGETGSNSTIITGVKVSGNSTLKADNATAAGGLVYIGTGYWQVKAGGIDINSIKIDAPKAASFGMIINKGNSDSRSIYLELLGNSGTTKAYTISAADLTLTSCTVFDELVAYSASSADAVLTNGQGIVSINTYDGAEESSKRLKMGSDDTYTGNTYENQTSFAIKLNPNTRYYYNLDQYKTTASSNAEKLLMWSVYQYAHSSIQDYFSSGKNITSVVGTEADPINMRGYSYYPIDLSESFTIGGPLYLYNTKFDATETAAADKRISSAAAQHKLIHNGLIRNLSGTLNVNSLSIDGEVSVIGGKSGVLVCGTVGSSASADPATVVIDGLTLAGIRVSGASGPLLINSATSNSVFNISGVTNAHNTAEETYYASGATIATALLGTIGSSTTSNLKVNFSQMKLDGRKSDYESSIGLDGLDTIYGTTRSLFTNATLINTFEYQDNSGSYGVYNYAQSLDWTAADAHLGNVTYGAEIDGTIENVDKDGISKQLKYNVSSYFTHPTTYNAAEKYGQFNNYFQKYVNITYSQGGTKHELRVNISESGFDGCGTYNDPYLITSSDDLKKIAGLINGTYTSSTSIKVPNYILDSSTANENSSETWCYNKSDHTEFTTYESGYYKTANGDISIDIIDLREYLAGAYYMIPSTVTTDIVLDSSYPGISNLKITDEKFVFRGVIIGNGATIVNESNNPLIISSNGSVIKNLTIEVNPRKNVYEANPKYIAGSNSLFTFKSGEFYGAVIGQILGGDNIIDDVSVTFVGDFSNNVVNALNKANGSIQAYAQLVPIGGYVGVVVNGGLIFRNMTGTAANGQAGITKDNLANFGDDDPTSSDTKRWLYVNPIIGRVINGYAVTESAAYRPYEDGKRVYHGGARTLDDGTEDPDGLVTETWSDGAVTMHNGTKNYSITDISKAEEKLSLTDASTISIPNGQAFFVMSAMVNSGMAKKSLGYNKAYAVSRYASYTNVGNASTSDDYDLAKNDVLGDGNISALPGYLAKAYTSNADYAADMAGQASTTITLTDNIYLPDGYKGIGNIYYNNDNYRLKVTNFDGGGYKISMNSSLYYYFARKSNVPIPENSTVTDYYVLEAYDSAYAHYSNKTNNARFGAGFGLFNIQTGTTTGSNSSKYYNFTLTGNVVSECIDRKSAIGDKVPYWAGDTTTNGNSDTGIDNLKMISAGMLIGESWGEQYLDSVAVDNIYVKGIRSAGGLIGWIPSSNTTYINAEKTASKDIKVHSGGNVGGMIGKSYNGKISIDNNNATYSLTEVVSDCDYRSGHDYNYGVGGFVGYARKNDGTTNIVTIKNVIVGDKNAATASEVKCSKDCIGGIYTGGFSGMQNRIALVTDNCKIYNQSVTSPYGVGGLLGYIATIKNSYDDIKISNVEIYSNGTSGAKIESTGTHTNSDGSKINETGGYINHVSAGGFVSGIKHDSNIPIYIMNSSITGYDINAVEVAGGVVGVLGHHPYSSNTDAQDNRLYLDNIKVCDCNITVSSTTDFSYAGGLVGVQYQYDTSKQRYLFGYNILEKDVTLTATNAGSISGFRSNDTYCVIKIAGFSRQGSSITEALVGSYPSTSELGTDGYVVFADYDDTESSSTKRSEVFSPFNADNNVAIGLTVSKVMQITNVKTTVTDSSGTTTTYSTETEELSVDDAITAYKMTVIEDNQYINQNGQWTANNTYSKKTTEYENVDSTIDPTHKENWGKIRYRTKTQQYNTNGTLKDANFSDYTHTGVKTADQNLKNIVKTTQTIDNKQTGVKTVTETTVTTFNIYDNSPYVTSSPKSIIAGEQFLTGDGVSSAAYNSSTASHIISAIKADESSKRYQSTGLTDDEIDALDTFLSSKIVPYKDAITAGNRSSYTGSNFPVLVIDDINSVTNTRITNYLRLLTNTDFNYGIEDKGSVYKVDISSWVFDTSSGTFKKNSEEPCLKRETGSTKGFYINPTDLDNDKWQFSLIDVQFYDPGNSTAAGSSNSIAYHLYVPVVVSKMLYYQFETRLSSGSTYRADTAAYPFSNNNLIDNFGNPITIVLKWTYRQSASDWASSINGGEKVYRNYEKTVELTDMNTGFPLGGASAVLVDRNAGRDRSYDYSFNKGGVTNGYLLPENGSAGAGSTTIYTLSIDELIGGHNNMVKLNDLMEVSIDADAETKNLVLWNSTKDSENDIIVEINSGDELKGQKLRMKKDSDPENVVTYAVAVNIPNTTNFQGNSTEKYIEEIYYLSLFTNGETTDPKVYHYTIKGPLEFGDTKYPSARLQTTTGTEVGDEISHLIIGHLYENDISLYEDTTVDDVITSSNRELKADLTAKIKFTDSAKASGIVTLISNENVHIYQTFLVGLNMNSDGTSTRGIIVPPNCSQKDFKINGSATYTDYPGDGGTEKNLTPIGDCVSSESFAEFPNGIDIREALVNSGDSDVILTTTISMLYPSDMSVISAQFPPGSETNNTSGTYMIGYSNIASNAATAASSRASNNTEKTGKSRKTLYYTKDTTPVSFNYNASKNAAFKDDGNGNYGQLGINGREIDEVHWGQINTTASYDASQYSMKNSGKYVKVKLVVKRKTNTLDENGVYKYGDNLDILKYFNDMVLTDKSGNQLVVYDPSGPEIKNNAIQYDASSNVYTYVFPRALLETDTDVYILNINFKSFSGNNSDFETKTSEDMFYANYKIEVTMGLQEDNGINSSWLEKSDKTDHVVYTNARIISDVIS